MHHKIKSILLLFVLIAFIYSCKNPQKQVIENQPYLLVLSMDGFRWDYPEKANTPTLDSLEKFGVRANLIPTFPTKTFPNHYSIATGLYPENHGIILNHFYNYELDKPYSMRIKEAKINPDFYKGEPIWNTAEKQGYKAASYFWIGSETPVQGKHQNYWKTYDHNFPFESIIDTVLYWLQLPHVERPHFITFYSHEPDDAGHKYGPNSTEIVNTFEFLDSLLSVFFTRINKLPIAKDLNIIVTSDHGMADIPSENTEFLDDYIKTEWIHRYEGSTPVFHIKAKEGFKDSIYLNLKRAEHFTVNHPEELPARMHYSNNLNVQDFVVIADSNWHVTWKKTANYVSKGSHGYDNRNTDMHAIFYAIGPSFKKGYRAESFENVHLYSLMAEILKIEPAQTDGSLDEVKNLLKE